jgi:hypothetical protein
VITTITRSAGDGSPGDRSPFRLRGSTACLARDAPATPGSEAAFCPTAPRPRASTRAARPARTSAPGLANLRISSVRVCAPAVVRCSYASVLACPPTFCGGGREADAVSWCLLFCPHGRTACPVRTVGQSPPGHECTLEEIVEAVAVSHPQVQAARPVDAAAGARRPPELDEPCFHVLG